jgi:NAD(P)-dependent dehydrogenase (short-subunit alcohol dehydrogenase family)
VSNKKIWFITGAGRGMGADFAKAALAGGHLVVATGRDTDRVSKALGQSNDLLPVKLDVTLTARTPKRPYGPPSIGSAASTYWSTMRPASTRASSKS